MTEHNQQTELGSDRSLGAASQRFTQREFDFDQSTTETDSIADTVCETMRQVSETEPPPLSPPMPVRRLHNYSYCPRLFYFQWVENLFEANGDTVAGSALHKNVDRPSHWKEEIELNERTNVRSLELESETLHLRGVIDLIEDDGGRKTIIDYKKGSAARDSQGYPCAKEADAIQLAAYAMLLNECENIQLDQAAIYYASDKRRIEVALDSDLFDTVKHKLREALQLAQSSKLPEPLIDDPRCLYCSAYPICLPNESAYWKSDNANKASKSGADQQKPAITPKRPPRPSIDDGEIIVVQTPRARVGKQAGEFVVSIGKNETVSKHPVEQVRSIYLYGAVQVSTQAIQTCLEKGIDVAYFSPAGRYLGRTSPPITSGVEARRGQYRLFEEEGLRKQLTCEIVRAKIINQRVLLMRNGKDVPKPALKKLKHLAELAANAQSIDRARGFEGAAAALYFEHFSLMIKPQGDGDLDTFDFNGRNRRPPRDPVNALLSQGYSILTKELAGVCESVGLDATMGFFHQPGFGKPALALDLMEEFRPLIADSVAISLINRGELTTSDFSTTSRGTFMKPNGRKQFWAAWFRRMDTEVTHPEFRYRMSYRRMLEVQARQLWRFVRGEAETYHAFTTR